ncbi:hypothetical protein M6D81_09795 [Paenibacillus sp. J5C_2022]|nr:hypothetical protein [Paenibacillus sp. J5C2022]MCU6709012.1 hypothetical protein [Paenibacillus sp. J5C2022]
MGTFYAELAIWLTGLFGLLGLLITSIYAFVKSDSRDYDERNVWLRKVKE